MVTKVIRKQKKVTILYLKYENCFRSQIVFHFVFYANVHKDVKNKHLLIYINYDISI